MQSLLPLSAATTTLQSLADPTGAGTAPPAASNKPDPSANVSLTDDETARLNQTYTPEGLLSSSAPVWEQDSSDAVSSLMSTNYAATALSDRFHNLGAALLDRFKFSGSDYSQSVMLRFPGSTTGTSQLDQIRQSQLHTVADNQVSLDIKTASGATVHLSLTNQSGGLGVQIEVKNGTLSATERNAIAGLADAFQGAIDGLTSVPPKLALDGLTQFDPSVLSSVNMQASFKLPDGTLQTLNFQADSLHRSVAYTGTAGSVNVDVDLSNPSLIGSADQQAHALASYLQQFDQAQSRGHANASLMEMFKDAFTTLNSNYGGAPTKGLSSAVPLTDADHAMLTGLADFTASVKATDASPNPVHADEKDSFSYDLSQQTDVQGHSLSTHSIQQSQQSHLAASYHEALYPDTPLDLTDSKYSQNYYYYQIDDTASSVANIAYKNGSLTDASVTQSSSQSTREQKYVAGKLEEDLTTPSSVTRTWNLLDLLQSAKPRDDGRATQADQSYWRSTLSSINDQIMLKASPAQLRAAQFSGAKEVNAA